MEKIISVFLIMCCLISMTACSKDEVIERYNQALQSVGDNGLTKNVDLQGKRSIGTDSYVGTYEVEYESFSGKEILFGGTALERNDGNEIEISCNMKITSGTLKIMLQTGTNEPEVLCDTQTSYSEILELSSASNYIIVEAENFTGSLKLTIE